MEIRIQAVSKRYKDKLALDRINLTISKGMFGLVGPNGAGKSTMMGILATLVPVTEGGITFGDLRLGRDDHEIRKVLGYLPQNFGLYPRLTGREFLEYIAALKGMKNAAQCKKAVDLMLERVNLTDKAGAKIRTYSGGMKQRLGIAQALLGDPKVIIVDEPTAGLDPEERIRFRNMLEDLSLERIILLSTHIVADIEQSCGAIAILDKGRLKFEGSPEQLLKKVEGRVWQGMLSEDRYHLVLPKSAKPVSKRKVNNGFEVRMLADEQPFAQAVQISPGLEDAYMALTGGDQDG